MACQAFVMRMMQELEKYEKGRKIAAEFKKVLAKLMESLEEAGYKGGKFRICHVENEELAAKVVALVKEKYPEADAVLYKARGLCSYYAERGGIILGCETE